MIAAEIEREYVHILTYPTPRFIRLFGKLRGDSDDITR